MEYIIITPVYNEEKYIRLTLDSVIAQTLLPKKWVIVNDGSTDCTENIIKEYVEKHDWIILVNNNNKEKRSVGSKVVRAFYLGYDKILNDDYDFIVKLDADITLPGGYFEKIAKTYQSDELIGMASGFCVINKKGRWIEEVSSPHHIRGPIKSYRRECFNDIGGLQPVLGWDGIDVMATWYKGWRTKVIDVAVKHHRITGTESSEKLASEYGRSYYLRGFSFFQGLLRSLSILINEHNAIKSWLFLKSFLFAYLKKEEKIVDKDFEIFIRKFQNKRICRSIKNRVKRKVLKNV